LKKEIIMLEKFAKLDSLVLRGLLVAAVGFIGVVLSLFGVSEGMFSEKAMKVVDAGMTLLTAVGLLYAANARINKPNPPLSDKAVAETARMVQDGTLKEITVREDER
jgi:hypothetical protein